MRYLFGLALLMLCLVSHVSAQQAPGQSPSATPAPANTFDYKSLIPKFGISELKEDGKMWYYDHRTSEKLCLTKQEAEKRHLNFRSALKPCDTDKLAR